MPYISKKQQRFAYATHQPWAKEWSKETDFKKLPERKKQQGGYSIDGYKNDSEDRNNLFNIIPSSSITMQNVPHKILGIDSTGFKQIMYPGKNYKFNSEKVLEIPLKQLGGSSIPGEQINNEFSTDNNYLPMAFHTLAAGQKMNKNLSDVEAKKTFWKSYNTLKNYGNDLADEVLGVTQDLSKTSEGDYSIALQNIAKRKLYSPNLTDSMRGLYTITSSEKDPLSLFSYDFNNKPTLLAKKQVGGLAPINSLNTDLSNIKTPILPEFEAPQINPQLISGNKQIQSKEKQNLSFVPLFTNSIAQAFASKINSSRENQYEQTNLANPLNIIPRVDNTNSFQNYGVQSFQKGGEVDDDYEDIQDEDFLFQESEPIEQPIEEEQQQIQTPSTEEEFQVPVDNSTFFIDGEEVSENNYAIPDISRNYKKIFSPSLDNEIAAVESGGNYKAQNPNSSASGKYQFLYNSWKPEIEKVTGIKSKQDFLNSPEAQENFFSYYKQNHMAPAIERLKQYNKKGLSEIELGKLYHFKGEEGARQYLIAGVDNTKKNNISIEKYLGR